MFLDFWHPPGPFLLAKQDNIMLTPSSSYAEMLLTSDDLTNLDTLGIGLSVRDIICVKGHGTWPSLAKSSKAVIEPHHQHISLVLTFVAHSECI